MRPVALAIALTACRSGPDAAPAPVCDCGVAVAASAEASASSAGSATPPSDPALSARARRGDPEALKQMELVRPADRSAEDCVAIAEGHRVLERDAVRAFGREIDEKPALLDDKNVLAKLFQHASDPDTADLALPAIARIKKPVGPDMLYEIWKHDPHAATQSLAEDLLLTKPVRKNASPDLEFALAIELEDDCKKLLELFEKSSDAADDRALPRLKKLEAESGCGKKKKDDCWPCLRGGNWITTARDAAKPKKRERPWEIRRR